MIYTGYTERNKQMLKLIKRRSGKIGLPPGTLLHIGDKPTESVTITIIDYSEERFTETSGVHAEDCIPYRDSPTVTWINVNGIHDPEIMNTIGEHFSIHPLVLEDIMNTGQRPKMEEYDANLYVVMKMLYTTEDDNEIVSEQLSFILGPSYVISFQERTGDVFDVIRDRLRYSKGRIRKQNADYLLYSLIDAVVDNYYIILEKYADEIETLEEEIVTNSTRETLRSIQILKRELLFLRGVVRPLREVSLGLEKVDTGLIRKKSGLYFRDVYDHIIEVMEAVETYREMLTGMLDIYLSGASNRMNEVMKTLTIFASIFIPLTFIAGVYGMNFKCMPELDWPWAYPALLSIMGILGITMAVVFKRKGWF